MNIPKIFDSEYRFCCVVWEHQPVRTGELVKLCEQQLNWKKSTVFTVLRRLCERGMLQNKDSVVTARYTREQVQRAESEEFLQRTFGGSLPQFIAAFAAGGRLTAEEIAALQKMIDEYKEG
ncbi:MAG: BlaI/MecI/CopY family transcriptional regulator [Clostridia bacterium]|nr:BlaI/MecI/CopY family transcriptional regulator [Clostridia bacterium]